MDSAAQPVHRLWQTALALTAIAVIALGLATGAPDLVALPGHRASSRALRASTEAVEDPVWGCGLLGKLPGIYADGTTSAETQRFVDALKLSSSYNKVTFWNWNLASDDPLTADFIFMPEQWGAGAVNEQWVRTAGTTHWKDNHGNPSPAQMADVFLGMNEPDIQGSCMGNMFGRCVKPCNDAARHSGTCPRADINMEEPVPFENPDGMCNCWESSYATGVGFWSLTGCSALQPLPDLWDQEEHCINTVMNNWKQTAAVAARKGYKYLSTPLLAVEVDYADKFIARACDCHDTPTGKPVCYRTKMEDGCPAYVGLHFYAFDCRPVSTGSYDSFKDRVQDIGNLMEKYDFLKGAIVNEVGMLNCVLPTPDNPICIPDSGEFPAKDVEDHGCPSNDELPNGLATFLTEILKIAIGVKTSDGRSVVKSFAWFNQDREGGTYNLRLFHDDGSVNAAGEAYMEVCQHWNEIAAA
mmetsp:Transcript_12019/g.22651  ORF Transcript_12019/g.22651 Transcript_12019/m.22651 type:complete len:469 (+) Transcript_12019:49-1455(+)